MCKRIRPGCEGPDVGINKCTVTPFQADLSELIGSYSKHYS